MNLSSSLKKNNNPKHYCLALCLRLQCTCQSELSTQNATVLGKQQLSLSLLTCVNLNTLWSIYADLLHLFTTY